MDPRWDGNVYPVQGYRNAFGAAVLPLGTIDQLAFPDAWPNDAIWPVELQLASTFHRKGHISNYDNFPEARDGDFVTDRDIDHGSQPYDGNQPVLDAFIPSAALNTLVEVYKFWIAFADLDGYRIDTVKHMEAGAVRYLPRRSTSSPKASARRISSSSARSQESATSPYRQWKKLGWMQPLGYRMWTGRWNC